MIEKKKYESLRNNSSRLFTKSLHLWQQNSYYHSNKLLNVFRKHAICAKFQSNTINLNYEIILKIFHVILSKLSYSCSQSVTSIICLDCCKTN